MRRGKRLLCGALALLMGLSLLAAGTVQQVYATKTDDEKAAAEKAPDAFDVQVAAAAFSHPGYTSLRFSVEDAIVKIVSANIAKGQTVESSLPALQTELVNLAKLNGYTVE